MIVILGYSESESEIINQTLLGNEIEFKYSLLEHHITKAEKIILPDANNLKLAYRKMQLTNLFSVLRLLNKPILGINNGFRLMCGEILSNNKCGLGFFQMDFDSSIEERKVENYPDIGIIHVKDDSKLLDSAFNKIEINFNKELQSTERQFSSSIIKVGEKNFSLTCEFKNYYSLEIDTYKNESITKAVINNFLKI